MNKIRVFPRVVFAKLFPRKLVPAFLSIAGLGLALLCSAAAQTTHKATKSASSPGAEEFFIISSVDVAKAQLLLKRPTEVTALMNTGPDTKVLDEKGKSAKVADLRAGDTVWVTSAASGPDRIALRIRKGPMTPSDLRRLYLHPTASN